MVLSSIQTIKKMAPTTRNPFLWRMTNAPACCAFSFTVLAALPVFFAVLAVISGSLTGALGGGIFLFNGLLLLPAGDRIAGKLGILPQGLLIQGVHVGLFQLLLGLGCLSVGLQLWPAITLPNQPVCRSLRPLRTCGRFPRPHCPVRSPDFLVDFPHCSMAGVSRTAWDSLEGGFFLSSSTSLVVTLRSPGPPSFAEPAFSGFWPAPYPLWRRPCPPYGWAFPAPGQPVPPP